MSPLVLEKLKKLLRLGESSNKAESELALAKAWELANKHGVDLSEVDSQENSESVAQETEFDSDKRTYKQEMIDSILCKFFNVGILLRRYNGEMTWIGKPTDILFAKWIRGYLDETWGRLAIVARNEAMMDGINFDFKSFYTGVAMGLQAKLEKMQSDVVAEGDRYAIAIRKAKDEVENFKEKNFSNIENSKIKMSNANAHSMMAGHRAGSEISINRPLSGSSAVGGYLK